MKKLNIIHNKLHQIYEIKSLYTRFWLIKHLSKGSKYIRRCNVRGYDILLDVEDIHELKRSDTFEIKEPETLNWIETYFEKGDVLYDIGANIGQYSLYAAAVLNKDCSIYAFEPGFHTYAKLNYNIFHNSFDDCITAYNIAFSDKSEMDTFYIGDMNKGSSSHNFKIEENFEKNALNTQFKQGVIAFSIDEVQSLWMLKSPTHIKIDVDGFEEFIVNGMENTLKSQQIKTVLIEITIIKGTRSPIFDIFARNNFKLIDQDKNMTETVKSTTGNYLFVKEGLEYNK